VARDESSNAQGVIRARNLAILQSVWAENTGASQHRVIELDSLAGTAAGHQKQSRVMRRCFFASQLSITPCTRSQSSTETIAS